MVKLLIKLKNMFHIWRQVQPLRVFSIFWTKSNFCLHIAECANIAKIFWRYLPPVIKKKNVFTLLCDAPDQKEVIYGIMVPHCKDCGSAQLLQGIAIVGAVIMPHNIYLHSALVQSRDINREKPKEIKLGNQNKIAHFKEPLRWLKF